MTTARDQLLATYYEVRRRRLGVAQDDFATFVQLVVKDDHARPLLLATMHRQWFAHVEFAWQRGLNAMVWAHFGSGKSTLLVVARAAWELGRDPNLRIKIVCNDDSSASKRVAAVKHILESTEYAEVFPNVQAGAKWSSHELFLQRSGQSIDPSLHARGVLTTGIGGRCDLLLFDDVVDQKNSEDPDQRRKISEFVEATWQSRLSPTGRTLWICTPWHLHDCSHQLLHKPNWLTLAQPVAQDCQLITQELTGPPGVADDPAYPFVFGPSPGDFKTTVTTTSNVGQQGA